MKKDRMPSWKRRDGIFVFILLVLMLCGFGVTRSGWVVQAAQAAPPRQGDDPYQLCDLIRGFVDNAGVDHDLTMLSNEN